MVSLNSWFLYSGASTNDMTAYGDTNLFCTCAPVEDEDSDITGAAAPTPT
jgi:hypothetical protein